MIFGLYPRQMRKLGLVENDFDLVHGLLEIKGTLVGSSWTKKDYSQFNNDGIILFFRPCPRNSIID